MDNPYINGDYLSATGTWHAQDSAWKSDRIFGMMRRNNLRPGTVAEIGCGAGGILHGLSKKPSLQNTRFSGYDISPQAIGLAKKNNNAALAFFNEDLLAQPPGLHFDCLLVIDVFEHVPDYLGFLEKCRTRADFKIFHIPLDLDALSIIKNSFQGARYRLGHLHYFTRDSALAALKDTGYTIIDSAYTEKAFGLFRQSPSPRLAMKALLVWLFSRISLHQTARLIGGFSLIVLAR